MLPGQKEISVLHPMISRKAKKILGPAATRTRGLSQAVLGFTLSETRKMLDDEELS